jgi:hypothetical protein
VLLAFPPVFPSLLPNPHRFCFSGDVEGVKITTNPTLKTAKIKRKMGAKNEHKK